MPPPSAQQLIEWIKPEPPTPEELEWAKNIQPGEYEINVEKLSNICLEAKEVFIRCGVSDMLRSGDLIVGIYTPAGDMVTSYCGTHLHAVSAQLPIKYIKKHPILGKEIKEGDVFYFNDPLYGGIHNPDQTAIMPIFYEGEHIGWSTASVHQPETGGTEPGGMCPTAKSRYDEGMRLSPIKIGENYRLRDDLMEMMANFVRTPRMQTTDVRARVTAADRIRIRTQEIVKVKGKEFLLGLFRKMIMQAEEGARNRIREWNDGIYRVVVFLDTMGFNVGLARAFVTLRKEGDRITVDFTGSSPENLTSYNAPPQTTIGYAASYIYNYPFPELPESSGTLAPFDWIFPEGTFLNPSPDAAMSNSAVTGTIGFFVVSHILAKLMFASKDRNLVTAPTNTGGPDGSYFGINQWGVPIAGIYTFILNSMGHGARPDMDGVNVHGFQVSPTSKVPDVEEWEGEIPLAILSQRHAKDMCGLGKYRGGAGGEQTMFTYGVPWMMLTHIASGSAMLPLGQGFFGGYPATRSFVTNIARTNLLEMLRKGSDEIPSNLYELLAKRAIQGDYSFKAVASQTYPLLEGEVFSTYMCGGCGYGDVLERNPDLVMDDLRNEIISHWVAENVCHVVYDRERLEVDYESTEQIRQRVREERLKKGKRYEEFEKEWSLLKPPDEALEFYGSWPDAQSVRPIIRY